MNAAAGIAAFLRQYCSNPPRLESEFYRPENLKRRAYRQDQQVCAEGDAAAELWILQSGRLGVYQGGRLISEHGPGDMVGEQAFLAPAPDGMRAPRRHAEVRALERSEVCCIGWDQLCAKLDDGARALLMEALARSLSHKLDQARAADVQLSDEVDHLDGLLSRFVCDEGLAAVRANVGDAAQDLSSFYRQGLVVVWFSDLAGFSLAVADLAPHAAAALLESFLDPQCVAIHRHGGQIDKLMGDGIMAWWPVPAPARADETAVSAVTAALQAVHDVHQAALRLGREVGLRIGLHMGDAALGNFGAGGRISFTVLGRTVNDAARYEQAREDDQCNKLSEVRISPEVMAAIAGAPTIVSQFEPQPRRFAGKPGEPTREVHVTR